MVVSRLDKSIFDILMMTIRNLLSKREKIYSRFIFVKEKKKKEMFIDINFHRFGILNLHTFQAKILK